MKYYITIIAILTAGFFALLPSNNVSAANKNDFDPGYIIDDYIFYNSGAMDSGQIQNFLNSKNPNCDYWGTKPASDWGYPNITHAQLAEYKRNGTNGFSKDSNYHAPPYRCLTMYSQSTPQIEAASGYCSAINAGTRTAAQIINDVAKACGINPQVLIILLEKEQSLVTDTWPLDIQLRHATGFGCPDTAPCDPSYEGFFYQVYNAARQFKVYKTFPNSYNYRAGRTNNIYWNPDLSRCGSSSVYIQNQATAALYIYTPYRPNEAALNNLYGTGDSCSSYGNRNFWRIFTDWFGSTKLNTGYNDILSRYNHLGSSNGPLGAQVGSVTLTREGLSYQSYQNGVITWTSSHGAWETINGPIRDRWVQLGASNGSLGAPTGPPTTEQDGRQWQAFQNGVITYSQATGAWETIAGKVRDRWVQLGASNGTLGLPTGPKVQTFDGRVYQYYQNGVIFWTSDTGAYAVINGPIRDRWVQAGGSVGKLGLPTNPLFTEQDGRQWQAFQNGVITWTSSTGAWETINGPIRDHWVQLGASNGSLGAPTGEVVQSNSSTHYQTFQKGVITWTSSHGSHATINGPVRNRWVQLNTSTGTLGSPISALFTEQDGRQWQAFQNGVITWTSSTGAWETINGPIRDHWVQLGASNGSLGAPTGEVVQSTEGTHSQNFRNGVITWSAATGTTHRIE